jgi:hypothetical protein
MSNKRRGPVKEVLIKRLTRKANKHHQAVKGHCQGLLDEAYLCGMALKKIRWELRRHWPTVRWKRWCNDNKGNLGFSYETAKVYWRIANTWDKPEMVKARAQGGIKSIAAYNKTLAMLQEQKPLTFSQLKNLVGRQMYRENIKAWFASDLRKLSFEELEVFEDRYNDYWEKFRKKLYHDTSTDLECDLDGWLYSKVEMKLKRWERKNANAQKSREYPYKNVPMWVIDADEKKYRADKRRQDQRAVRRRCVNVLTFAARLRKHKGATI